MNVKKSLFIVTLSIFSFGNTLEAKKAKSVDVCIAHGTPSTVIKDLKSNGHGEVGVLLEDAEKLIKKLSLTTQLRLLANRKAIKAALIKYIEKNL